MDPSSTSATTSFFYETLDSLSLSAAAVCPDDLFPADTYAVLRNHITSPVASVDAADLPAADYFSLDVSADVGADVEERTPLRAPRPSSSSAPRSAEKSRTTASESAWFRAGRRFKSPMIQLHKEIVDFCDFVSPTLEEQVSRADAVHCVSEVIKYIWPHCKVEVFGSFRTGLYLPTSDIDVVILDSSINTAQMGLHALARELKQRSIAKKIQVIAKARVPIIKFVEKRSGIAFDVRKAISNINMDICNEEIKVGPKTTVSHKISLNHMTTSLEPRIGGSAVRSADGGRGGSASRQGFGGEAPERYSDLTIWVSFDSCRQGKKPSSIKRRSQAMPSSFQDSEETCTSYSISGVCNEF